MNDLFTNKPDSTSTGLFPVLLLLVIVTAVLYIMSWLNLLQTVFSFITALIAGHLSRDT
jgi:hypothetical protein